MRRMLMVLVIPALVATACNWLGAKRSKRAVEGAIQAHLKQNSRLSLGNFTTTVEEVKFDGSTAQARVKFQSKESADLAVEVGYGLKFESGQWQVISSAPLSGQGMSAQSPHDTPSTVPPGAQPSTPAVPAPEPSH
ncbi:MAG TPA: hypothetical protein VGW33_01400 [Terriglobia bacterium]|nr:hypothetical protein [Terriglobia bacterium]